jgi:cysteine desulfurase
MSANKNNSIYFDNASTTPLDSRVWDAMLPYGDITFGNPSSLHLYGMNAKDMLERFRAELADCIHAQPEEIIFTSGGTEANNFALKGVAFANRNKGKHIIVSAIEHDSILNTCKWLEEQGFYVSYLNVDENGFVDLEKLKQLINPQTILVSVMHANNEIGTIEPIEEIGKICKANDVPFHTDACQSFGKIPIDVSQQHISMMSLNAHKIHGIKGIGALYIKRGIAITPLLHGGGQEFGLRSTTENLAGIAGFAKAARLCIDEMKIESERLAELQGKLIDTLENKFAGFYLNGDREKRLPNNINFSISGLEGENIRLLLLLDEKGVAVSAGSACSNNDSGKSSSHVLEAIGRDPFQSKGGIRISFGRFTTEEEINRFVDIFELAVSQLNTIYS